MNNAVGVSPVLEMLRREILVGLGTDGMSSDMPAQMCCAYLLHRLAARDSRVGFCDALQQLLDNNAAIANRLFGCPRLGELSVGAGADLAILDDVPPTSLTAQNSLGHLIFGMVEATVDTTVASGQALMEGKEIRSLDVERIMARSRALAAGLWGRIHSRRR